jgi:hypothetical protein
MYDFCIISRINHLSTRLRAIHLVLDPRSVVAFNLLALSFVILCFIEKIQ